jgi:DNA-3-methyladenine glycosylase I
MVATRSQTSKTASAPLASSSSANLSTGKKSRSRKPVTTSDDDAPSPPKQKKPKATPASATKEPVQTCSDGKVRCFWAIGDPDSLMTRYHDDEWGIPVHDDQKLFEMLVLESAQAGLSWNTILNKRANYQAAFDNFDIKTVAAYDSEKVASLLAEDSGIVKNRAKVGAAIDGAKLVLTIQEEFGSFDKYLWKFVPNGKPIENEFEKFADIPTKTAEAEALSKDLKKRGFKFVGPTIMYAFMQATGMTQDHFKQCHKYQK